MQLEAIDITFKYEKNMPYILEHASLTIRSEEIVGLVAKSGSGKSTLCKLLAGYLKPLEGQVLLNGIPLAKKGICPVQLIYQHPEKAINPRWKMKQVLEESGQWEEQWITLLGIEKEWLNRYPRELSGGELQRFCIARSLLKETKFLIADEISTMLDAITQAQLWNVLITQVKERKLGMLVVTHNMALAEKICTKIVNL